MRNKDPHEYWIFCKKLIKIYNEIKDYRKVGNILEKGFKVMQNLCDKASML